MKTKEVIRFFKRYFYNEKLLFIKSFIFLLISSIIGISFGYLIGKSLDHATNKNYTLAIIILIIYLVLSILDNMVFKKIGKISIKKVSMNVMSKISYEVYYKVGLLPARAFEEKSSGEYINRITNDASSITETFRHLINAGTTFLSALLIFIYILFNSWVIALEIIIYFIIFYYFSSKYLPLIKENQKEITKEKDKTISEVNESIRGIREIRALGIRENINKNIKSIIDIIFFKNKKQMIDEEKYYALTYTLGSMLEVAAFITCIILVAIGKNTFGFFIAITYYIYRFMYLVEWAMNVSSSYQKMKVSVERVDEIINNKLYKDNTFGNLNKTDIEGIIEFKNVTFKYSNEENNIFENLNLEIPKNKKVAIVGKSGQGKSSIFNLLLRYFDPDQGVILIDDIPLQDFDEESLRKNIAIIRQDPFLFNKSIIENFKVLDKYISLKKIREVCKKAEIDEYIMNLPNKYNTIIGEGGVNLSGGQKQRIAIARALLKDSKILLFDEATSALDNENQEKIKLAIDNLVIDHTVIIIAHRLSTIIDADLIYLIDNGKVVAKGKHNYLMKNNELYKNLYKNEK